MPVLLNPFQFGARYRAAVLADAPLLYYNLDDASGDALDSGSAAINAPWTGTPTRGVTGPGSLGAGAVTLAGTQRAVAASQPTVWQSGTASLTVECWLKFTSTSVMTAVANDTASGSTAANRGWDVRVSSGKVNFIVFKTGSGSLNWNLLSTATINDGNWHQVVCTYDGANITIWLDKVQDSTLAATGNMNGLTGTKPSVGANSGGANPFTGSIDEGSMYTTVLSSTRIAAHFDAA